MNRLIHDLVQEMERTKDDLTKVVKVKSGDSNQPQVGIFWYTDKLLEKDHCSVDGITLGTKLKQYPLRHQDVWLSYQIEFPELRKYGKFDQCPRGRIVYSVPDDLYVILISPQLRNKVNEIKRFFKLKKVKTSIEDLHAHYKTEFSGDPIKDRIMLKSR